MLFMYSVKHFNYYFNKSFYFDELFHLCSSKSVSMNINERKMFKFKKVFNFDVAHIYYLLF